MNRHSPFPFVALSQATVWAWILLFSSGASILPVQAWTCVPSPLTIPLFAKSRQGLTRVVGKAAHSDASVPSSAVTDVDAAIMGRYACTRFQRFDGNATTTTSPSVSNPAVVRQALNCLDLARRAPSGFNAQPYKLVLVHSPSQKQALARYCLGHNAHRVRDSDCTAVFLADREVMRSMGAYKSFLLADATTTTNTNWKGRQRKWAWLKVQALIAMFSSGYPVPRFMAVPISFCVRVAMSVLSVCTRRKLLLPSLSGAETWSTKNVMLVAMAYMLGCSSRGLATCPMEGFNAGGIRKALNIPRRYSIPVIVCTGQPYIRPISVAAMSNDSSDDVGMTHGIGSGKSTPRYPIEEILYGDTFGSRMELST